MPRERERRKKRAPKKDGGRNQILKQKQDVRVNVRIEGDRTRKGGKRKGNKKRGREEGGRDVAGPVVATNVQFPGFGFAQPQSHGPMSMGMGHDFGLLSNRVEELRSGLSRLENERQARAFQSPSPIFTPPSLVPNTVRPPPSDSPFNQMGALMGRNLFSDADATMMSDRPNSEPSTFFDGGSSSDVTMLSQYDGFNRTPPGSDGPALAQMLGSAFSPSPSGGMGQAISPVRQETPLTVEEIESIPTPPPPHKSMTSRIKGLGQKLLDATRRFNEAIEKEGEASSSSSPLLEAGSSYSSSPLRTEFPGFSPITQPREIQGLKTEDFLFNTPSRSRVKIEEIEKPGPSTPLMITDGRESPEEAEKGLSPDSFYRKKIPDEDPEARKKRLRFNSLISYYFDLKRDHPELTPEVDFADSTYESLKKTVDRVRREIGEFKDARGRFKPFRPRMLDVDVEVEPAKPKKRAGKSLTTPGASGSTALLAPGTPGQPSVKPPPKKKGKKT